MIGDRTIGSLWKEVSLPSFSDHRKDQKTDICIIGSGITGITTAYLLSKAGKKVIVIDKSAIAGGETSFTTAHLTFILDDRCFELEKLHGIEKTRKILESHRAAINHIESICREEKIDADFRRVDGYLFLGQKDSEKTLEKEKEILKKLQYDVIITHGPQNIGPCLKYPLQAQFHPLKYMAELIRIIRKNGGEIYKDSLVQDVKEEKDTVIIKFENGHTIEAESAIIATNTPFNDRFTMHTKQAAYRSYVIAGEIPKNSIRPGLYWDTEDPYHYVRLHTEGSGFLSKDILIVGGEDHKTGQDTENDKHYQHLREWAEKYFPKMKVQYQWSGQIIEPIDSIAYIGLNPSNKRVYIATGYSGNGMTYGTIAGMLLSDLIMANKNILAEIYDPSRKNLKSAGTFIEENANVALQYLEVMTPKKPLSWESMQKEEGIVAQDGLQKVAVYKGKNGRICKFSAICPHLGCVVRWNKTEKTWDCPCHGSRFSAYGKMLNGPAKTDLKTVEHNEGTIPNI